MGLLDRSMDKIMVKAEEKLEVRFGELRAILQDMLVELRRMNAKMGPEVLDSTSDLRGDQGG